MSLMNMMVKSTASDFSRSFRDMYMQANLLVYIDFNKVQWHLIFTIIYKTKMLIITLKPMRFSEMYLVCYVEKKGALNPTHS